MKFASHLERLERDLKKQLPEIKNIVAEIPKNIGAIQSGTTALAIKYDGGVLLAADKRTSSGYFIYEHESKKLYPLTVCSALTAAGTVAFIQFTTSVFRKNLRDFELENDFVMPFKAQAKVLSSILRFMSFYIGIIPSDYILAGFDHSENVPKIYDFDCLGGMHEKKRYWATGSGGDYAITVMDDRMYNLSPDKAISRDDAFWIAIRAIRASGRRDMGSGPPELTGLNMIMIGPKELKDINLAKLKDLPHSPHRPQKQTTTPETEPATDAISVVRGSSSDISQGGA